MWKKKDEEIKEQSVICSECSLSYEDIEDLCNKRFEESGNILVILNDFPGSSYDEIWQLEGCCMDCLNRALAWLESTNLIYQEGGFYYLSEIEE